MSKKDIPEETLLGIDLGQTNVGLAFGRNGFVSPIKIVSGTNREEAIKEIVRVCIENKISKIVMGLPITAEGKETQESQYVRQFTNRMKAFVKIPVEYQNEFLTTQNAMTSAINSGMSQKSRRKIDHLSAALILKSYYDEHEANASF